MNTRFAFALILLFVAVAIGCKKRGGTGRTGDDAPGAPQGDTLPPPPETYPNTVGGKVARALDEAAVLAGKSRPESAWRRRLAGLKDEVPWEKLVDGRSLVGVDASADRELIDAAFARLGRSLRRMPEVNFEEIQTRYVERYSEQKLGTAEQARLRAVEVHGLPQRFRITDSGDARVKSGLYGGYFDADVTDGTRATWTGGAFPVISGTVRFRERLTIAGTQGIYAQLRGEVGELRMESGFGTAVVDLAELKVGEVSVGAGGVAYRIGPGVRVVGFDFGIANARGDYQGVILVRGNPTFRVAVKPTPTDREPVLTVIRY